MKYYHEQDHLARIIDKDASIEHRHKCTFCVKLIYSIIDEVVRSTDLNHPVFLMNMNMLKVLLFKSTKSHVFQNLQLSVPVDIVSRLVLSFNCLSIPWRSSTLEYIVVIINWQTRNDCCFRSKRNRLHLWQPSAASLFTTPWPNQMPELDTVIDFHWITLLFQGTWSWWSVLFMCTRKCCSRSKFKVKILNCFTNLWIL